MADKTIVVGDVHVGPNQNLRRAKWLGRLVKDVKPERVVFIGDFGTFDSLSNWDKDKRKLMEGRRYAKDVGALQNFVKTYRNEVPFIDDVRHILTEGNHEHRIARYIETHPEMEGQLDYLQEIGVKDEWKFVPYKSFYKYRGVSFTHVPIMENGRPVSGVSCMSRALQAVSGSVVFGHTHKLEYKACHRHGQSHLQEALNVGCYFEHIDEYAKGSVTSYWRGLVVLDHYKNGRFAYEAVPMGMLRRDYD